MYLHFTRNQMHFKLIKMRKCVLKSRVKNGEEGEKLKKKGGKKITIISF